MTAPRFCASCGAALTEGARFCAACGVAVEDADAPSFAPTTTDASAPSDMQIREILLTRGKIEAIKHVRERTGLGLAEAKYRVDVVASGMSPGSIPKSSDRGTCLGCLAALAVGIALIVAGFTGLVRMSGAYKQAIDMARADPRIVAALGEPIEASPFAMGKIASGSGRWSVRADIGLSGPKGKGTLRLRATTMRRYGDPRWDQYSVFEYYKNGEPYEIALNAQAGSSTPR